MLRTQGRYSLAAVLTPPPPPLSLAAQAGLLSAQVGFDALFFGRADYQACRRGGGGGGGGAAAAATFRGLHRHPQRLGVQLRRAWRLAPDHSGLEAAWRGWGGKLGPTARLFPRPLLPSALASNVLAQDMEKRRSERALEVVWRGSGSLADADVFTGNFPSGGWVGSLVCVFADVPT